MDSVDCDIVTIDYNIDSLLKEKASKLVARELFQKRIRNLKAQGDLEAESFRAFLDAYNLKHKALLERERQVKVGMEATLELQRRVQRLLDAMREEIATLKKKASELQLDIAADCAAAYRLGHNANFLFNYYELEHREALNKELTNTTTNYRLAIRQSLPEKAQEFSTKIDDLKTRLTASNKKIAKWDTKTRLLENFVEEPWKFLCANAVDGPAAAGACRISVHTSEENRAAWDVGDRELERPEGWNEAMKEEADQIKTLLLLDAQ